MSVLAALAFVAAAPLPQPPPMGQAMAALQADDTRLLSVGWRLARANAAFCPQAAPGIGLMLYDARNFAQSEAVRAALGTKGDIALGALAAQSPTARAGLGPGAELLAIGGVPVAGATPVREGDTARVDGLHDRIDAALAADGSVTLLLADRAAELVGEPVCRARFELATQGVRARSDGFRVQIGQASLAELPDEAAFAALVAHELAHAILAHPQRLAASRRTPDAVRATEREADRLAPWLMANAGYDPAAALDWARGWARRHDGGLLRDGTHDGWQARAALIARELEAIAAARAATPAGPLDWRTAFPVTPPD